MKRNLGARNIAAIALLIILAPILYWRLNKVGYLPPLNYLFVAHNNKNIKLPKTRDNLLNYNRPITEIINTSLDKSQTAIKIEKSRKTLTIYYRQKAIKSYPIVLGQSPVGDKLKEGDYKTPEGTFKIRDLYPHSSWSKFIWLDYPTQESWRKHLAAKQAGKISFVSRIGSEIGIHGVPNNGDYLIDSNSNWTWGCISLKNKDVDEIYEVVRVGTIVEIVP